MSRVDIGWDGEWLYGDGYQSETTGKRILNANLDVKDTDTRPYKHHNAFGQGFFSTISVIIKR